MSELLSRAAAAFGDALFIEEGERTVSFAEAEAAVVARGRTPASLAPTLDLDSVLDVLAAIRSGGVVLLGPAWPPSLARVRQAAIGPHRFPGTVVFTSGSSGAAKAVRLLESNWEAAGTNSSAYFGYGPGDRWLLSLPLHHVSGLSIVFRALCSGGSVLISSDLRDLCKVEFASLVPTQLARLDDYGRVRTLVIGGGGLSESLTTRVAEWPVVRTYGMTETAAVAASAPLADGLGALHPLPGVEFQIGDRGRIEVRGEQVSPGYVGQPPRRPEEWLITADRGRIHPDGSIEVLGRADRIINSGGAKVDPAAVEGVIRAQPGIEDVAVFGVPDPEWGELVGAAYVGSAETAELQTVVAQALGREAVPRRIRRVSHLPRTELGKLDYPALIDLSE